MGKKKRQVDHSVRADGDSSDSIEEYQTKTKVVGCPHANKAVHLPGVKKALKQHGFPTECSECIKGKTSNNTGVEGANEDGSILICLKCGLNGCGSGHKHSEQHSNNRQSDVHDLALNLSTWVVWCFKCNRDIPYLSSSKKLQECYDFVKKFPANSIEGKSVGVEKEPEVKPSVSFAASQSRKASNSMVHPPSFESLQVPTYSFLDSLPKVRGLANLGNTCFFNAVLQCLGQTPFLLRILEEMKEGGEKFRLPGGEIQIGEEKVDLVSSEKFIMTELRSGDRGVTTRVLQEPLEGTLKGWSHLTEVLAETLSELKSGKPEVYYPRELLHLLHRKCPQFAGYGQHDSHELLRQLLEMVRTEDLQRYQQAILESLNLDKKSDRDNITEEMRKKVKAYGKQANDLLLRPEQVFRGFLVSTLECQECHHMSDHVESFLDLSLPVMADKPVHIRPKSNYEEGGDLSPSVPSKHQLKMKRKAAAKSRKSRHRNSQPFNAAGDSAMGEKSVKNSSDSDNLDQSDADVEDNVENEPELNQNPDVVESGYSSEKPFNGDSTCGSPASEKNVQLNRDSAIASPITNDNLVVDNPTDQVLDLTIPESSISKHNVLISSPGSQVSMACQPSPLTSSSETNLECRLSSADQDNDPPVKSDRPTSRFEYNAESASDPFAEKAAAPYGINGNENDRCNDDVNDRLLNSESEKMTRLENGFGKIFLDPAGKEKIISSLYDKDDDEDEDDGENLSKSSDGGFAQRNNGEAPGECTLRSCLSQFTAKELMIANNKVGCEACTKRVNQGKEGKTVLTNTSKQLLVSSPPAVLILHLKRFQVSRCAFKKKCGEVKFPEILDLAPYSSNRFKDGHSVKKNQKEILYSLYGVVEHMGTFHRGHYVAYVKVRSPLKPDDPRWSFLPKNAGESLAEETKDTNAENSIQNGAVGGRPEAPPGKWYYVSDSCTLEVREKRVLSSEAYLLFYERIL